ncbi:MAG TPA: DUF1572 family protein [Candidatus Acidoferrales bacterium]|nr:DUF1572 family protein [Candidatus Acidoferrales bacterium]
MPGTFIAATTRELRSLKRAADRAMVQLTDEQFFAALDPESNSIAVLVKHLAGNMRSRWSDFLTTDGEKPFRRRDDEFRIEAADTRASLAERWEEGWKILLGTLEALSPADLERTVTIRTEPYTALGAVQRSLAHYSDHIGQIILLAKYFAGAKWQTLSIPRGKSEEANAAFVEKMRGKTQKAG